MKKLSLVVVTCFIGLLFVLLSACKKDENEENKPQILGEPCPGISSITYGGQVYNTVQIGNQCWMKENLNIGIQIPGGTDMQDNDVIEKYCNENSVQNCEIYGGLYQWNELMQYSNQQGTQGICPSGWHIPTDEEWEILEGTADSQYDFGDSEWGSYQTRGFDVGTNLKSSSGWGDDYNGTDLYGFKALPGGSYANGAFFEPGGMANWFTSTEVNNESAMFRSILFDYTGVDRRDLKKDFAVSIRCIKD